MIILASFFLYRQQLQVKFGNISLLLVKYVRFAALIKVIYQVTIQCDFIQYHYKA